MVSQLLRHERIETTVAKAKELKRLADKVVTIAKEVCANVTACIDAHRLQACDICRAICMPGERPLKLCEAMT